MNDLHKLECVAWRYIDWPCLIRDMIEYGMTPFAIARAMAVPPSTPYNWLQGTEPRYSHGEALLLLHSRTFGVEFSRNRIMAFREAALMRSTDPEKQTGERTNAESRRESCRTG